MSDDRHARGAALVAILKDARRERKRGRTSRRNARTVTAGSGARNRVSMHDLPTLPQPWSCPARVGLGAKPASVGYFTQTLCRNATARRDRLGRSTAPVARAPRPEEHPCPPRPATRHERTPPAGARRDHASSATGPSIPHTSASARRASPRRRASSGSDRPVQRASPGGVSTRSRIVTSPGGPDSLVIRTRHLPAGIGHHSSPTVQVTPTRPTLHPLLGPTGTVLIASGADTDGS